MKFLDDIRNSYEGKVYNNSQEMHLKRSHAQDYIAPARPYQLPIAAIIALSLIYKSDALNSGLVGGLLLVALSALAGAKFLDMVEEAAAATSSVQYRFVRR